MEILRNAMSILGIDVDNGKIDVFKKYRDLVIDRNTKVNLTAITDPKDFEIKHFVDSILAAAFSGFKDAGNVIDIGTGAGFPGLPLAICFPDKQFVLVDSLNKRIRIINEIIDILDINNAIALHGRAEDLANKAEHRDKYDICVSRAVAELSVLAEYCLPFVRTGGFFGAYKTLEALKELQNSNKALKQLGGCYHVATKVNLNGVETNHQILWIKKVSRTPAKFPRKAGMPSKEPLK